MELRAPAMIRRSTTGRWVLRGAAAASRLLVEALLPAACPVCSGPLSMPSGGVCGHCWDDVERSAFPAGAGQASPGRHLASLTVVGPYEGALRTIVRRLKSGDLPGVGAPLARRLAAGLTAPPGGFHLVVPVPLHPLRRWRRGFNQSEAIASALARLTRTPAAPRALRRIRATPPQRGRSRRERLANVRGAFSATPPAWRRRGARVRGATILLVDDVVTTGATMRECARTLRAAGAGCVHGAAAARTTLQLPIRGADAP